MGEEKSINPAEAFGDKRVILVKWDDDRCGSFWDESSAGHEQAEDGPTHLVIGARAPDEKLRRLSERFGLTFDQLRAFRDREVTAASVGPLL